MRISSDSARRRNRDRSSLTSASAAGRTRRPVLGEPAGRFGLRDDREDLNGFTRDVIKQLTSPRRGTAIAMWSKRIEHTELRENRRLLPLDQVEVDGGAETGAV